MSVCAVGKRPFDALDTPFGSPIHHHGFDQSGYMAGLGTPPKRCRAGSPPLVASPSMSPSGTYNFAYDAGMSTSPPRKMPIRRTATPSRYLPATMGEVNVDDVIERVAPRRKRVRLFANPSAGDSAPHQGSSTAAMNAATPPSHASNEVLFTLEQVKAIVQRALDEKDAAMREEFDVIIRQQLAEQFEIFTKVNEDYISRQMRESTFDYMS